jgi:PKD repeat protein
MYIDDVTVYRVFTHDLTITNAYPVRQKDTNSCEVLPGNAIKVNVKNQGSTAMSGFTLTASILHGEVVSFVSQQYTQTLAPGEQILVSFTEGLELSPQEIYDIELRVENTSDLNEVNNLFLLENVDLRTYYTGFEIDDENAEWSVVNLTGTNTWHIDNTADLAHSGTKYYRIRTDQQPTDDWLISGCHALKSGVCYTLSFWYRSRFSTENLEVYIGTNPTNVGMVNILNINNFNSNIYLNSTSQFSVPQDGVYYLAFRTAGGTSQKYYIHIDDITLKVGDESPTINPQFTVLDKEVMFFANAQYINEFLWDFGNGNTSNNENPTFTFPGTGTYTVTLTATGACGVLIREITVEIESTLEAAFTFEVNGPVVSFEAQTNARSASWNFGDGNFGSGLTTFNQYLVANTYPVTLTVYDGISSLSVSQNVTTVVNNVAEDVVSKIIVYPNPASHSITVEGDIAGSLIRLYDLTGKHVKSVKMAYSLETVDISDFAPGIYLFRVVSNDRDISGTFIKQ